MKLVQEVREGYMGMQWPGSKWDRRLLNNWVKLIERLNVDHDFDRFYWFEKTTGYLYTRLKGKVKLGYYPSIRAPQTFNEKSIHRRLFSRHPLWPIITDKLAVRSWLKDEGLDQGLGFIPLLGIIEDIDRFDFEGLSGPIVIKASWGAGLNLFIDDPLTEDWAVIKQRLANWQQQPYKPKNLAWSDTHKKRVFLVERRYSLPGTQMLQDYKFFVFHGRVELLQTIIDRENDVKTSYYDRSLKRLTGITRAGKTSGGTLDAGVAAMVPLAERIGGRFDFVRVDFYMHEGEILFGEITPCPANGFSALVPTEFDLELGRKWHYDPKACHDAL